LRAILEVPIAGEDMHILCPFLETLGHSRATYCQHRMNVRPKKMKLLQIQKEIVNNLGSARGLKGL
jgi:hypothetical protein